MNKKMMILGAGAALLLGSVALAQSSPTSGAANGSDPSAAATSSPAGNTAAANSTSTASNASQSSTDTAATASDPNATQQAGERG